MDPLLVKCRAGDNAAMETLVRRYQAKALDLARALTRDDQLAEDAVQDAFVSVFAELDRLRDDDVFWGWLRQIIRTKCSRIVRKRKELINAEPPEMTDLSPSPEEQADRHDINALVRGALASLPAINRRAAEMFYLEERQCLDIGGSLGIPEGTVKRRLFDARQQLRRLLLDRLPEATPERPAQQPQIPL